MLSIEELKKRTIKILESTKKHMNKYEYERKKLYEYYINEDTANLEEWSEYIIEIEKIVNQ